MFRLPFQRIGLLATGLLACSFAGPANYARESTSVESGKRVDWRSFIVQTDSFLSRVIVDEREQETECVVVVFDSSSSMRTPVGSGQLIRVSRVLKSLIRKYAEMRCLVLFDGDGNLLARYESGSRFSDEQRAFLEGRMEVLETYSYQSGSSPQYGLASAMDLIEYDFAKDKVSLVVLGDELYVSREEDRQLLRSVSEFAIHKDVSFSAYYLGFVTIEQVGDPYFSLFKSYLDEMARVCTAAEGRLYGVAF